jgi:hypothetical protein
MLRKHPNMPLPTHDYPDHDGHDHHPAEGQNRQPLILVGTDSEAFTALDIAASIDVLVYGIISDDKKHLMADFNDHTVHAILGTPDADRLIKDENIAVLVACYDIEARRKLVRRVREIREAPLATLLHALSAVSLYSRQGMGSVVNAGGYIGSGAEIGDYTYIGANTTVEADAKVGDLCTIQSGACLGRGAHVFNEVFIGNGAIIGAGVKVGEGAIVAPGAVVMRDVDPGTTVMGNPAVAKK